MDPYYLFAIYAVLAGLVVFLAIKLSDYVDAIDKKTKLSGALLGGILLAGVTSLPELFTSFSGLFFNDNSMVLGNIMGSDFFDIIIFGAVYFIFFKKLTEGNVGNQHYSTCFYTALMLIAVVGAILLNHYDLVLFGWFNPMSIVIIAIYVISVVTTPKVEEKDEKEESTLNLTIKQIWILFAVCSVILIGASISVTYVTKLIVENFHIDASFAGSLFLGVATSLPEVTATIALCNKKNFNAAYGDILGSCVFNIIILGLTDIFSFNVGKLYNISTSSMLLIIGTAVALILIYLSILFIKSKHFKNDTKSRIILYSLGFLMVASYIVYLAISSSGIALI